MKTIHLDPSKLLGFHAVRPSAESRGPSRQRVKVVPSAKSATKNGVKAGLKGGAKVGAKLGIKA